MYQELVSQGKGEEYLAKFVFEPESHYEYIERIGVEHLYGLRRVL